METDTNSPPPRPWISAIEISSIKKPMADVITSARAHLQQLGAEYEIAVEDGKRLVVRFTDRQESTRFFYRMGGTGIAVRSLPPGEFD